MTYSKSKPAENRSGKASRPAARATVAFTLLFGLTLAAHICALDYHQRDLADDALISARYARNLAYGHGLVYNRAPADLAPVEGYSNFAWVLGLSAGFKLGVGPRVSTSAMGVAFSALSIIALFWWVWRETGSRWAGLAAMAALASWPAYAVWAVQGLETAMFACLLALSAALYRPGLFPGLAYLAALAAALTRPDGFLAFAAVLAGDLFSLRGKRTKALLSSLFYILPFAVYTTFRLEYFGDLLPNTYHAKTGLGMAGVITGLRYLGDWAVEQWPALLLLAAGAAALRARVVPASLKMAAILAGSYLAFVAWAGGDFMPDHRFTMHALPLIVGMGFIGAWRLSARGRDAFWLLALTAVAWNVVGYWRYETGDSFSREWHRRQAEWYGPVSEWLLVNADRTSAVAAGDIGYIGFISDLDRIIDTNGLVDRYLAALPGAASLATDPAYVLDLEPDYLVVMEHRYPGGAVLGHSAFDRAVVMEEKFQSGYELAHETPGWRSVEKSQEDGVVRESDVVFKIFRKSPLEVP